MSSRLTFPKRLKLRERSDFQKVLKSGQRLVGRAVCLDWRLTSLREPRFGVTVSKRYGAAHERNRFKRIAREAFRLLLPALTCSFDLNVVPRQKAKTISMQDLQKEFFELLGRIS